MPKLTLPAMAWKPWLAGCMVHSPSSLHLPSIPVQVERHTLQTLLDSDSTMGLAQPSILPDASGPRSSIMVTCMHGDTQEVATTNIQIGDERGE